MLENSFLQSSNRRIVKLTSHHNFYLEAPRDTQSYPVEFLKDLSKINKFTSDSNSWIIGQFIRYLFIIENKTAELVNEKVCIQNVQKPYVG